VQPSPFQRIERIEIPEGSDALNQRDLDVSHTGKVKGRFGDATGLGKGNRALGMAGDLASKIIDLLRELRM
jgi:hypothetical protein